MLEEIKKQFTLQQLKHFVFRRYSSLLLNTYPQTNPSFGSLLIQTILQSIFAISILFQKQFKEYWTTPQIETLISYCSYINLSNLYINPLMDLIIQSIIIGILLLYILFFIIFLCGELSKTLQILMSQFTRILRVCCVPYFHVVLFNLYCKNCYSLHYITKPLLTTIFVIFLVCISATISFHFNPIASKSNILIRLHSNFYLYTYWLNFIKVLIYQSKGFDLEFVGIVFFIDLAKLYYIRGEEESRVRLLLRAPELISMLTCAQILFVQFNSNFSFGVFGIWLISILVFFFTVVLQWFLKYQNIIKVYDCLNTNEREMIQMSQQFMMKDWNSLTNDELFMYITYICFHSNRCTDIKCILKVEEVKLNKINLNHLDQYSSEIKNVFIRFLLKLLRKYSSFSPLVCTQYYILCSYTNQNLNLLNIYPTTSIIQEYIRYIVRQKEISEINTEENITIENYDQSKSQLFCQFNKIINSLKQFLIELKVKKPNLDILMKYGYSSHQQIAELKKLFMKILRSDFFDLRIIEIYMEFMINILKEEDCNDYISRISKNKWLSSSKNLDMTDSSMPLLQIDPAEDKIFNMNAEAIKILKFHKMDIYDKKVSSFLYPFNNEDTLEKLFNELLVKNKFCFIKDATEKKIPVILNSKVKKGNKQCYYLQIQNQSKFKEETFILIDANRQFIESHPSHLSSSKFNCDPRINTSLNTNIDIKEQYQKSIFPKINELFDTRFINYQCQNCLIHAALSQTIHPQFYYIKLSLKRRVDGFSSQNSIIQRPTTQQLEFHPFINLNKNRSPEIILSGEFQVEGEGDSDSDGNRRQSGESIDLNLDDLDTVGKQLLLDYQINYAEGIKSYRLDKDMIYNIQLEENGQEKANNIVQQKFKLAKHEDHYSRKKKIRLFYTFLAILSLIYIGVHIYVNVVKLNILKKHSTEHPLQTILMFQTRFQRMFGVLRDAYLKVNYTTTTTWNKQLQNLFNSIQNQQKSLKFSKQSLSFTLLNTTYTSFLDYACNIFITQMYRMGLYNTTQNFQQINSRSIQYLDPAITRQKQNTMNQLSSQLITYVFIQIFTISFHFVIVLLILWLVISINYHYRNKKYIIMEPWRLLPDEEIQSIIDRLSIFEIQLMLSERNEEVEIYDSLKDTGQYKKREYPKQFNKKNDKKNLYWTIFILFLLVLGIIIHGYSLLVSNTQANLMYNSLLIDYRVPSSYIQLVRASKYKSIITNDSVLTLNSIVNDIQRIIPDLNYDSSFINTLNMIFFGDHCLIMQSVLPNLTSCSNYSTGFLYPNPLEMGYLIDVSALTFSMLDNITNLYISSGIIGYVYEIGVITFVNLLMAEKIQMIERIYQDEFGYSMTSIILCFGVSVVAMLVYWTNIKGIEMIESVSRLLNVAMDKGKGEEKDKGKKGNEREREMGKNGNKKRVSYERLPSDAKQQ